MMSQAEKFGMAFGLLAIGFAFGQWNVTDHVALQNKQILTVEGKNFASVSANQQIIIDLLHKQFKIMCRRRLEPECPNIASEVKAAAKPIAVPKL